MWSKREASTIILFLPFVKLILKNGFKPLGSVDKELFKSHKMEVQVMWWLTPPPSPHSTFVYSISLLPPKGENLGYKHTRTHSHSKLKLGFVFLPRDDNFGMPYVDTVVNRGPLTLYLI